MRFLSLRTILAHLKLLLPGALILSPPALGSLHAEEGDLRITIIWRDYPNEYKKLFEQYDLYLYDQEENFLESIAIAGDEVAIKPSLSDIAKTMTWKCSMGKVQQAIRPEGGQDAFGFYRLKHSLPYQLQLSFKSQKDIVQEQKEDILRKLARPVHEMSFSELRAEIRSLDGFLKNGLVSFADFSPPQQRASRMRELFDAFCRKAVLEEPFRRQLREDEKCRVLFADLLARTTAAHLDACDSNPHATTESFGHLIAGFLFTCRLIGTDKGEWSWGAEYENRFGDDLRLAKGSPREPFMHWLMLTIDSNRAQWKETVKSLSLRVESPSFVALDKAFSSEVEDWNMYAVERFTVELKKRE